MTTQVSFAISYAKKDQRGVCLFMYIYTGFVCTNTRLFCAHHSHPLFVKTHVFFFFVAQTYSTFVHTLARGCEGLNTDVAYSSTVEVACSQEGVHTDVVAYSSTVDVARRTGVATVATCCCSGTVKAARHTDVACSSTIDVAGHFDVDTVAPSMLLQY